MAGPRRNIAIVGYGTGGQTAAILLAADGHRVTVFEQAPSPGPVGAGFLLQPTGMAVLWELGLLSETLRLGRVIRRLDGFSHVGRPVMAMAYRDLDARLFGLGLQRGALFQVLRAALPAEVDLRAGVRIVAAEDEGRLLIDSAGTRHGPFDICVAADGSASALRRQAGLPGLDRPYPWGALWCLLPAAGWVTDSGLLQRYRTARVMAGVLPVGCRQDDPTDRVSFFWSVPQAEFASWPAAGMAAWRRELAVLWPELEQHLPSDFAAAALARASYCDAVPERWHRGRIVLLGDAAHAMSPQLGQGVNMALLDARSLAHALRTESDIGAAFDRYARDRRAHVGAYQWMSRWLTPLFQSDLDWVARQRDRFFLPLGRLPGGRQVMLRVLTGTQRGWFGRFRLPAAFMDALGEFSARH